MKITTIWNDSGEGYCLLSAYSETDYDIWGGIPEWHHDLVAGCSDPMRELILEVPDVIVANLFKVPTVGARVVVD